MNNALGVTPEHNRQSWKLKVAATRVVPVP
jgi:hypothetical protein